MCRRAAFNVEASARTGGCRAAGRPRYEPHLAAGLGRVVTGRQAAEGVRDRLRGPDPGADGGPEHLGAARRDRAHSGDAGFVTPGQFPLAGPLGGVGGVVRTVGPGLTAGELGHPGVGGVACADPEQVQVQPGGSNVRLRQDADRCHRQRIRPRVAAAQRHGQRHRDRVPGAVGGGQPGRYGADQAGRVLHGQFQARRHPAAIAAQPLVQQQRGRPPGQPYARDDRSRGAGRGPADRADHVLGGAAGQVHRRPCHRGHGGHPGSAR